MPVKRKSPRKVVKRRVVKRKSSVKRKSPTRRGGAYTVHFPTETHEILPFAGNVASGSWHLGKTLGTKFSNSLIEAYRNHSLGKEVAKQRRYF